MSSICLVGIITILLCDYEIISEGNGYAEKMYEKKEITEYLYAQGLTYGYSSYWNANVNTALSNGDVRISSIKISDDGILAQKWLSCYNWYSENEYVGKTFLLVDENEYEDYCKLDSGYMPHPVDYLKYKDFIILVYSENIARYVKR